MPISSITHRETPQGNIYAYVSVDVECLFDEFYKPDTPVVSLKSVVERWLAIRTKDVPLLIDLTGVTAINPLAAGAILSFRSRLAPNGTPDDLVKSHLLVSLIVTDKSLENFLVNLHYDRKIRIFKKEELFQRAYDDINNIDIGIRCAEI